MLTSQRKTQIVEEQVTAMLQRVKRRAEAYNQDGAMMGDTPLPGKERLNRYWAVTPDLSDIELITDPDYEMRLRQGLDRAPVNPYWINLLRVPGLFTETAKDFVRLVVADEKKGGSNEVAQSPEQPPVTAGGGLPLPQTPAPGSPQPAASGYSGGYGAP